MDSKRSFTDSVIRIAALIGLLLVLLLGAWGIILLAFNLPTIAKNVGTSIVSLFQYSPTTGGSTTPNGVGVITVSAPASIKSGTPFVVSWTADKADSSYSYTVSYACQNGLSLKAPMANGSYESVSCSTPFNYTGETEKMTLVASAAGTASIPATIVVSATHKGDTTLIASGSIGVMVGGTSAVTTPTPTTGSGNTTYVPSNHTTNLYGTADLAVRILSVNSLSSQQGRVAVQFEISNVGTNVAPAGWMFSATLPVGYSYIYNSQTQQALYPGDRIVYTLGFTSAINNQYCSIQNPNTNCPWYQQPYQPYPYQGICYRYDGYQNIPVACPSSINPNYDYYNYNDGYNYQYGYNSQYGYTNGYYSNNNYYQGNLVMITVDPRNTVADYNRANNTASAPNPVMY
jgi:hypothetical protein